jgi:drug/metabolite transporter (DMT)-like permease
MADTLNYPRKARHAALATSTALVILVILLGNDWGLQYAAAKLMANEGVPALGGLLAMHLCLAPAFVTILMLRGGLFQLTRHHVVFFAAIGALSNVGQLGSELIAARHVSAGELTLINSLIPLFTVLIVVAFRTEPLSRNKLLALFTGIAAATAIILPEAPSTEWAELSWTLFAFISPVSAAIAGVTLARFWPDDLDAMQVATGSLVAGALWLVPLAILSGEPVTLIGATPAATFGTLLFLATVAVEFYLMALITRLGGAIFASCSDFIAVCAGLFWGFVFFAEIPTGWMIAAALLCLAALKFAANSTVAERQPVLPD